MNRQKYTECRENIYESEFQSIHNLKDLHSENDYRGYDTYKGIEVEFLEEMFGEDWQEIFSNAWNNKKDYLNNDYNKFCYQEWRENKK